MAPLGDGCGELDSGTCRLPRLGDDCGRSNGCAFGDSGLSCAPVEVVTNEDRTYARSACIRSKPPGAGCDLVGANNICGTDDNGDWQLCLGGACRASPNGAVVGDQCTRAQCADGSACVYNLALTGLPVAVCANATRVAGDLIVSSVAGALRGGKFQVEEMSSLSANSIDAAVDKVQVKKGSTVEATAGDVSIMAMREVQVEEGAVVRAKGGAVSLMAGREVQLKITSTVSSDVSVVVSAPKCQAEQPSTVTAPDVKVCMM